MPAAHYKQMSLPMEAPKTAPTVAPLALPGVMGEVRRPFSFSISTSEQPLYHLLKRSSPLIKFCTQPECMFFFIPPAEIKVI